MTDKDTVAVSDAEVNMADTSWYDYIHADYGKLGWIRRLNFGRLVFKAERWNGGIVFQVILYDRGIDLNTAQSDGGDG